MLIKRYITLGCIFLFLLSSQSTLATIRFFQGSFEELQAQSRRTNVPYFISFYTSDCEPCRNMDRQVYGDPTLTQYVSENYLAFKANAESISTGGTQLAQQFGVILFPTILIFNPNGELRHKIAGVKTADGLLAELRKGRPLASDLTANPNINIPVVSQSNNPSPSPHFENDFLPDPALNRPTVTPVLPNEGMGREMGTREAVSNPVHGLYQVNLQKVAKGGFGVQIGVFRNYSNALREIERLESAFHNNVMLHVGALRGETAYRIVLGPFASYPQASSYRKYLKSNEGRDGIVVDLNRL